MKNTKTNLFVVVCFMICGGIGVNNIITNNSQTIINELQDEEELIAGDSFLNYGIIKGLKNTDYELSANVSPSNHSSKIIWTSDYPEFVSVEPSNGDKAIIRRLEDFKGYVNIKASIDGLEAVCKVYSIASLRYLDVSLSNQTTSLSIDGYYYDSFDSNNISYSLVVNVDISHDYVYFDKIANEGNFTYDELSEIIDAENNINLYEPNFLRLENIKTNFKLSNTNLYESYTITYIYINASTEMDWEFEYHNFYSLICSFTEYISATSINFKNESLII
ncbi:MAG: hypothetical protein ACI311_01650 [Bacilli bacterium]